MNRFTRLHPTGHAKMSAAVTTLTPSERSTVSQCSSGKAISTRIDPMRVEQIVGLTDWYLVRTPSKPTSAAISVSSQNDSRSRS